MRTIVTASTVAFLFLVACGSKQVAGIEDFEASVQEIQVLQHHIANKQQQVRDIVSAYNQSVPQARRLNIDSSVPSHEEDCSVVRMLDRESDPSCRTVLEMVEAAHIEMLELRDRIDQIKGTLPQPVGVRKGDNHYTLCLDYLMSGHDLSREDAAKLLSKTVLNRSLLEGSKVWMFYADGKFATCTSADLQLLTLPRESVLRADAVTPPDSADIRTMLVGTVQMAK